MKPFAKSALAALGALIPVSATADHVDAPTVDSDLSVRLTIHSQGETRFFRGTTRMSVDRIRLGNRELLGITELYAGQQFPRGSRLLATSTNADATPGSIWVVDRDGTPLYDASDLMGVVLYKRDEVTASVSRDASSSVQATNFLLIGFDLNITPPALPVSDGESAEGSLPTLVSVLPGTTGPGALTGAGSERVSSRYNRFRDTTTTTARASANVSGLGLSNGDDVVIDGSVQLSGRVDVVGD